MLSRSRIFIERDYKKLQNCKLWGIEAHPVNAEDYYFWFALIKGEIETNWEGGIFKLYLKFDEHYNDRPPEAFFHTIPFHPNVNPTTGQVALDFLCELDKWKSSFDVVHILLSIQAMLSNPRLDLVVNTEAADLFSLNSEEYSAVVRKCVEASKQVSLQYGGQNSRKSSAEDSFLRKGLSSNVDRVKSTVINLNKTNTRVSSASSESEHKPALASIAFEDYYQLWNQIGTSQSSLRPLSKTEVSRKASPVNKQSNQTTRLNGYSGSATAPTAAAAAAAAAAMKRETRSVRVLSGEKRCTPEDMIKDDEDNIPLDDDVDELVSWTSQLRTDVV